MAMTKPTSDQITFLNTVTLPGDLAVNGADITTTSTGTATVFNANATTLNVGGAATAVSIGAATGTTTVNNDLAVNGGDITTSATGTATVFNTNATTLNAGGAATTVSIGAATGTASINNATFRFNSGYGSVATAYGVRAWCNFDGTLSTPISPRGSGNVSSITDNGTGNYIVNLSNSLPDTTGSVVATTNWGSAGYGIAAWDSGLTASAIPIRTYLPSSGVPNDSTYIFVAVIR